MSILYQAGHEGSDVAISVKDILSQATQWQQFARTIKRRLPTDGSAGPINLNTEAQVKLRQASTHIMRLLKTMHSWCRMVTQQLPILTEADVGVPVAKMRELAHAAADIIYIDDDFNDGGFHDNVRASSSFVTSTYSTVSCALVDGHYDFDGTPNTDASVV